jgi:hypothetical protein
VLEVDFQDDLKIPGLGLNPGKKDDSGSNCREMALGKKADQSKDQDQGQDQDRKESKDKSAVSCKILYCVDSPSTDENSDRLEFIIPKDDSYLFRFSSKNQDAKNYHVRLSALSGGNSAARIQSIECHVSSDRIGNDSLLTVGALTAAFGKQEAKPDLNRVDIRIKQITDLLTPPSTGASSNGNATPGATGPGTSTPANGHGAGHGTSTGSNLPGRHVSHGGSHRGIASVSTASAKGDRANAINVTTVTDRDLSTGEVEYLTARPNFGIQVAGSLSAFGGKTISPVEEGVKSKAVQLEMEYQPSFLQGLGVIGIGPSVGIYPTSGTVPDTGQKVANSPASLFAFGGQARYQLKYWTQQPLVPYVTYEYQSLRYSLADGGTGRLSIAGGSVGVSFLLNAIAPREGRDVYRNLGIARAYLVAELKKLKGNDQNVAVSGNSLYFGVRCEF